MLNNKKHVCNFQMYLFCIADYKKEDEVIRWILTTHVSVKKEYLYGDTVTVLLTSGSWGTSGLWSPHLWRTVDDKQTFTMWVCYQNINRLQFNIYSFLFKQTNTEKVNTYCEKQAKFH